MFRKFAKVVLAIEMLLFPVLVLALLLARPIAIEVAGVSEFLPSKFFFLSDWHEFLSTHALLSPSAQCSLQTFLLFACLSIL